MPVFVFLSADVNRRLFSSGFSRTVFLTILAPFACYIDDAFFTGSMRIGVVDAGRGTVFHMVFVSSFAFSIAPVTVLLTGIFFSVIMVVPDFPGFFSYFFFVRWYLGFLESSIDRRGSLAVPSVFFCFSLVFFFVPVILKIERKEFRAAPSAEWGGVPRQSRHERFLGKRNGT